MPKFSIIIPTTRSHLLKGALLSVISQDCCDFEVVVSDNQSEGAEAIVLGLSDERIKYFRTPKRLAMPENWEFGLKQSTGDYILYLGDDDAIAPQLLSILNQEISANPSVKVFNWLWASFYDDNWAAQGIAGKFCIPPFTGRRSLINSSDILSELFNIKDVIDFPKLKRYLPSVLHACFRRDVYVNAAAVSKRFFYPTCPDYGSAVVILAFAENQICIDEPLVIYGVTQDSNGAASLGNRDAYWTWFREFSEPIFDTVPLNSPTLTRNAVADTILTVRNAFPAQLQSYQYNWGAYFKNCYGNIIALQSQGVNVDLELAEFKKVLAGQSIDIQQQVKKFKNSLRWAQLKKTYSPMRIGRRVLSAMPMFRALLKQFQPTKSISTQGTTLDAKTVGLNDIADCAHYLGEVLRNDTARKGLGLK